MQSRRLARFAMVVGCLAALALIGPQGLGGEKTPQDLLTKANNAFDKHNYADAARDYLAFLEAGAKGEDLHHAGQRLIMARLRLQLFDPALEAAEQYVKRTAGTPYEARAARLAGNLYLSVPHWGTRAGGKFHRSQWKQGIHVRSFVFDKRHGVALLERSRDLYAHYDAPERAKDLEVLPKDERKAWHDERIECLFDLAGVCARFGIYENSWWFWYSFWGERDEFLAETAGENDFDEYNSYWQQQRKRPIGLRVGADGNPVFPSAPKEYGKNLSDDEKILFLLAEVRKLDRSDNKEFEALSYYRQAMLSRARFGTDRLNQYAGMYYWGGGHPLQKELEDFNPWQLKDDEALVLAGGRIRMVKLPKQWDVLGLLRVVEGDYGRAGLSSQAQYSIGVYHQSRQQYTTALGEYDKLETKYPGSNYVNMADQQVERILRPQVRVSQAGVQLPGDPAHVQISYRNTGKVWFVARRIDHEGFLRELRSQEPDRKRGFRYFYQLRNWHYHFVNGYNADRKIDHIVENYVGQEVARWSEEVKNDGTHRYATATLQIPMDRPGAYLVYAYLNAPPVTDADKRGKYALTLGDSRAVVSLTDLAIVDKKVEGGNLFFICNARTGAPVPKATVRALEIWSTYNRKLKRSEYFREMHEVVTDEQGLALLRYPKRNERGQMHLLVRAGSGESKRVAWSGMSYWSYYNPSRMRSGTFAYCITDRPVYRPGQEVRFKVWMRTMQNGIFSNRPDHSVTLTVYDVRGNKVHESSHRSDQYGGFDGSFTLGEEPALGMYRLQVSGQSYAGGQNFRVEEYKKPEFEVTVEPGKTHTKLGDVITASIKAEYFFGGAVTEASVKYKVFREEYRHRYYFPGVWDWLYGPGYGWAWYDYDWYPWWGAVRCCRIAPVWWWGWHGRGGYSPIRELVQQGEAAIGHDGKLEVKIDTAPALRDHPDRDHRYVIQAEVRDQSRRVITGEGSVKVTRQAYYAMVQPQSSYVRPGQEFVVKIRCATPANTPVKAEGVVTISEVVFGGPNNAHIKETQLQTWKASTDERGNLEFRLRHEKSGQLKIKFEAPDEWGGVVEGYGIVWVAGDDFDGRLQRFNDLEILTDKRSYEPGEVAHVLINTKRDDSYVLFSDNVDNNHMLSWKLLHLPKRTTVVDVPITREGRPNFFIEATTVSGTRVHQQVRRIVVPPAEGVLNLTVTTDKPEYGPGERARIDVTATTLNGEPVQAQVTVSAFDKSVLYIQPELTPAIAKFFHGNLRRHSAQMTTNLVEQFSAWGDVMRPFQHLYPLPPAWYGIWGPSVRSWQRFDKEDVGRLGGRGSRSRSELQSKGRANDFDEDRAEGEVAQESAAGAFANGAARGK
ncbi:MAG: MG2 domain-containing protein, partial [Planctomycetota bacterium]